MQAMYVSNALMTTKSLLCVGGRGREDANMRRQGEDGSQ